MNVVVQRPDLRCFYICLEVMNSHENVIINVFGNVTPLILEERADERLCRPGETRIRARSGRKGLACNT